jgi:DNA ligase D-like protein (predicted 3'-phosphoesterase)
MPLFVIQEHHARTHHFDFRLEKDGVFKSWAVPKGLPEKAGIKRLAVQVEDHDLAFGDFEGTIPEGQYGAGTVAVWDRGEFSADEWLPDRIVVTLHGQMLQGRFQMIRFKRGGPRDWLVFQSPLATGTVQESPGRRTAVSAG